MFQNEILFMEIVVNHQKNMYFFQVIVCRLFFIFVVFLIIIYSGLKNKKMKYSLKNNLTDYYSHTEERER